jgi:dihydrofolate reductase
MRKVILYIAMTLDGMIADLNDGFSFLEPYDGVNLVKESYDALLKSVDTILMGRRTYEVITSHNIPWPYHGYQCYVYGSKMIESKDATIIHDDVSRHVLELKGQSGKDIWLVGGGKLVQALLESDLIDQMIITVIPVIFGSGISLFLPLSDIHHFDLTDVQTEAGLSMLTYHKHR